MIETAVRTVLGHAARARPPVVSWIMTRRCNMHCLHCYPASESNPGTAELGFEEQVEAARKLSAANVQVVFLSGGEPLLLPRLFDLVGVMRRLGLRVWLCTNGSLIDEGIARLITASGIEGVSVSLDSTDDAVHDRLRCHAGAWEKALHATRLLREAGLVVDVECTLTRINRPDLCALHSLATELGVASLGVKRFRPLGRGRENAELLALTLDAYHETVNGLIDARRNGGADVHFDDPAVYVRHRQLGSFGGTRMNGWHSTFGCLAGFVWIGLQPNGNLTPCPLLEIPVCNILRDDVATALDRSRVITRLGDRHDRGGRCGACDSRLDCGGCRAAAYAASGDYLAEDPFCVYASPSNEQMTVTTTCDPPVAWSPSRGAG